MTAHVTVTTPVSVIVTSEEIEEIKKVDPPRAAAPAPATLPSTGSPLPMILLLAVVMLAVAVTLTLLRRL